MLKLGFLLFRLRDYTTPMLIPLLYWAKPTLQTFIIGLLVLLLGEIIRLYGVCYIGRISRTREKLTGSQVITQGPFRFCRNPLYIGNLLILIGVFIIANVHISYLGQNSPLIIVLSIIVLFFAQYIPIVAWEESNLVKIFGKDYEDYINKVPRWFPSPFKYYAKEDFEPEIRHGLRSERDTFIAIALTLGFFIFHILYFG